MSDFIETLFAEIGIRQLPGSGMKWFSDRTSLGDTLQQRDSLTMFADDPDERSLRALIPT